ncbi:MAG: thiamine phosphate synthase [Verrucomicrobiota bacterium]|jgi:thiamine-phosphate pyrophosphorylase
MKPLADCRLYAFVDTAYFHGRAPEVIAQQLCDGGADLIQLRAKKSTPDEIRRMAERILPVTRRANVGLVINDHLDIARETGAEFCHLGQEDFFDAGHTHVSQLKGRDAALRRPPGRPGGATLPEVRIGLSTHAPEQAERALAAGPDYIAIGPVYATGTKPTAKPVTLEYVRWAAENVKIPWFAIGGINLRTLDDVLAAGAKRVCVVSAILNANDVMKACAEFRHRLG